ncbi:MAG: hypothetical protein CMO40_02615 [Verrucomicrobiaceae bacterium]|nr:hypothetical protein [Verrucomicrobiaceae bacterium]
MSGGDSLQNRAPENRAPRGFRLPERTPWAGRRSCFAGYSESSAIPRRGQPEGELTTFLSYRGSPDGFQLLRTLLEKMDGGEVSALAVEPVQSRGGAVVPLAGFS